MNLYIKNYILSVTNTILGLAFSIVTFPYVCRVLGTENIGVLNFVYAYGYYFMHIASFGINSYAIRELSRVRDDSIEREKVSNEIFNINIISSLSSFLLYTIGVSICSQLNTHFWLFFMYSFTILTNFLTLDWMLQSFDDYWFTTIRSVVIRILSICAVFMFVKSSSDIYLYMTISCISELGSRFFTLNYCRSEYVKLVVSSAYLNFREHFMPLFRLFMFRLINGISANLDKLTLGFYLSYYDVGVYSAAIKFVLVVIPLIETVGIVIFPKVTVLAKTDTTAYMKSLKLNYDIILCLSIPMAIGLALVSKRFILLFAGNEFSDAVFICRLLSVIIVLCPIGDFLGSKILLINNRDKELLICSSIIAVSNIITNVIFIRLWGLAGVTIATIICYLLGVLLRYCYAQKVISFPLFSINLFKYSALTLPFVILYCVFQSCVDNSNLCMIAFIVVSIFMYVLGLYLTKDNVFSIVTKRIFKTKF